MTSPRVKTALVRLGARVTIALHFSSRARGEWLSSNRKAVGLIERVMIELRPHLPSVGPITFRLDQLFDSHPDVSNEALWRRSLESGARWKGPPRHNMTLGGILGCALDRVMVVVVSGRLGDLTERLCKRLSRYQTHRFLGGLIVDEQDRVHQAVYLSELMTPIGTLHPNGSVACELGCVDYSPEIEDMWAKHGIESHFPKATQKEMLSLLEPQQEPNGPS